VCLSPKTILIKLRIIDHISVGKLKMKVKY
jgi:hypothetical protein